jgi:hypothetical protein
MTPMRVAQSALAPLLLRGEQPLNRPEFCESVGLKCVYSVEGHVLTPRYMLHTIGRSLYAALIQTLGPFPHSSGIEDFVRKSRILQPRRGCSRIKKQNPGGSAE